MSSNFSGSAYDNEQNGEWTKYWDENRGRHYYANTVTGQVSWTIPKSNASEQFTEPQAFAVTDRVGWFQVWDPQRERFYYCNQDTGQVSWELPKVDSKGNHITNNQSKSTKTNEDSEPFRTHDSVAPTVPLNAPNTTNLTCSVTCPTPEEKCSVQEEKVLDPSRRTGEKAPAIMNSVAKSLETNVELERTTKKLGSSSSGFPKHDVKSHQTEPQKATETQKQNTMPSVLFSSITRQHLSNSVLGATREYAAENGVNRGESSISRTETDTNTLVRQRKEEHILSAVRHSTMFASMPLPALRSLVSQCRELHYKNGDLILSKGEPGYCLFIVRTGRVVMTRGSTEKLPGDVFGEVAALSGTRRISDFFASAKAQSVVTVDDGRGGRRQTVLAAPEASANHPGFLTVSCWALPVSTFLRMFDSAHSSIRAFTRRVCAFYEDSGALLARVALLEDTTLFRRLKASKAFRHFNRVDFDALKKHCEQFEVRGDQNIIFKSGEPVEVDDAAVYIVLDGSCSLVHPTKGGNGGNTKTVPVGHVAGAEALFAPPHSKAVRQATFQVNSKSGAVLWKISRSAFESMERKAETGEFANHPGLASFVRTICQTYHPKMATTAARVARWLGFRGENPLPGATCEGRVQGPRRALAPGGTELSERQRGAAPVGSQAALVRQTHDAVLRLQAFARGSQVRRRKNSSLNSGESNEPEEKDWPSGTLMIKVRKIKFKDSRRHAAKAVKVEFRLEPTGSSGSCATAIVQKDGAVSWAQSLEDEAVAKDKTNATQGKKTNKALWKKILGRTKSRKEDKTFREKRLANFNLDDDSWLTPSHSSFTSVRNSRGTKIGVRLYFPGQSSKYLFLWCPVVHIHLLSIQQPAVDGVKKGSSSRHSAKVKGTFEKVTQIAHGALEAEELLTDSMDFGLHEVPLMDKSNVAQNGPIATLELSSEFFSHEKFIHGVETVERRPPLMDRVLYSFTTLAMKQSTSPRRGSHSCSRLLLAEDVLYAARTVSLPTTPKAWDDLLEGPKGLDCTGYIGRSTGPQVGRLISVTTFAGICALQNLWRQCQPQ